MIWIFVGIIFAIVAVLVIMRVKSDEQSMLMIRERTAFEIFATGMFLVTVIFLATGDLSIGRFLGLCSELWLAIFLPGAAIQAIMESIKFRPLPHLLNLGNLLLTPRQKNSNFPACREDRTTMRCLGATLAKPEVLRSRRVNLLPNVGCTAPQSFIAIYQS